MNTHRLQFTKLAVAALFAAASSFHVMLFYSGFISSLPRPMQGESVKVAWSVCQVGLLTIPVALPGLVSLAAIRDRRLLRAFLLMLVAFTALWYFSGFDGLLSKAWRRGL